MQIETAPKSIWQELTNWGKSLPEWQRFIVSHAVRDGTLTPERVDDAYRLFLRQGALDNGDETLPELPTSVTGRGMPDTGGPFTLKEITSLTDVNAIPESSSLKFGDGLTVVYGHNGAGKSGFARILAAACFSRSEPRIIGNIYDDDRIARDARATFLVERGNRAIESLSFKVGDEHTDLQRISVFDAAAARVHLSKENDLGFQPAGFDVFDEVVRVIGLIRARIDEAIERRHKPNRFVQLFSDSSDVSALVGRLDDKSDVAELVELARFGETEGKRLDEVLQRESELIADSPINALEAIETSIEDVSKIKALVDDVGEKLGRTACDEIRNLIEEHEAASLAANKAGSEAIQHPQLRQIGSDDWKSFVAASRNLALAENESYPSEGDPCLLCHRPLDALSAPLIRRMWEVLEQEAAKAAHATEEKLDRLIESLGQVEADLLPSESRIREQLSRQDPSLVAKLDVASSSLKRRKQKMVWALDLRNKGTLPSEPFEPPYKALSTSLTKLEAQKSDLQTGQVRKVLHGLRQEHVSLRHRQVLSQNIDEVLDFVSDLKWVQQATRFKSRSTSPRFATDKQRALFGTLIEGRYKEQLTQECSKLNCTLPIEFRAKGRIGRTVKGLTALGGNKAEEIFSEGEQRALALADFLTEVGLNPGSAGIVLDDPVTSLDHARKSAIAGRLVEEAKDRQVVAFTHDLVFLSFLA